MRIVGYFNNLKEANEAVKALKEAGFENTFSDMNDHYIADQDVNHDLPGTENSVSLSGIIMHTGDIDMDMSKRPLAAADPAVSGMSDMEEITNINNKVVVETNFKNAKNAKSIMENMGGTLDDPNVKTPKGLENIDLEDINNDNMKLD